MYEAIATTARDRTMICLCLPIVFRILFVILIGMKNKV
jgi:hypothetical protein